MSKFLKNIGKFALGALLCAGTATTGRAISIDVGDGFLFVREDGGTRWLTTFRSEDWTCAELDLLYRQLAAAGGRDEAVTRIGAAIRMGSHLPEAPDLAASSRPRATPGPDLDPYGRPSTPNPSPQGSTELKDAQVQYLRNIARGAIYNRDSCFNTNLGEDRIPALCELATRIRRMEEDHPDHYSVLVASSVHFLPFQTIARELAARATGKDPGDTVFFRSPRATLSQDRDQFFGKYPSLLLAEKWLAEESKATDLADSEMPECDTSPAISAELLSASLSLELHRNLDSALFVFLGNSGMREINETASGRKDFAVQYVKGLFEDYQIGKNRYGGHLEALTRHPRSSTGLVTQILIPKKAIRKYAYVSLPGGFLDPRQDADIAEYFDRFAREKSGLATLTEMDNEQVRLLAGTLMASKEVVMKQYSLIPDSEMDTYRKTVKNLISEILD